VKRYLYGDLYRLRSSRRREQETHRHGDVLWLLKKLRPAHKPIADFRQPNRKPIRQLCRTLTRLGTKLALGGADLVASDGSKCRAVHAQERHCTQDQLTQSIAPLAERVEADRKELARSDAYDARGTVGGAQAVALEAKIEALKPRQLRDEGFQAPLLATHRAPRSVTDPESRRHETRPRPWHSSRLQGADGR
jgi:transposase